MPRSTFLDYAKGILILLVVIGHTVQYVVYQDQGFWNDPLFKFIYMFHMPLFMGISGYLSYASIQKAETLDFISSKVRTYVVPILAWALLYETALFIMLRKTSLSELPVSIFTEFIGSLWFIWALLACLIVTVLIKCAGRLFWPLYAATGLLILLLPERGNLIMVKFMFPFFQAGYLLAAIKRSDLQKLYSRPMVLAALAGTVVCYLFWDQDSYIYGSGMALTRDNLHNILLRLAGGFCASILVLACLLQIEPRTPLRIKTTLETLGRDSIFIYILQGYVFIMILRVAPRLYAPITNPAAGTFLAIVLGGLLALVCWWMGTVLNRSDLAGAVLFGKKKRSDKPAAVPISRTAPSPE